MPQPPIPRAPLSPTCLQSSWLGRGGDFLVILQDLYHSTTAPLATGLWMLLLHCTALVLLYVGMIIAHLAVGLDVLEGAGVARGA